jgi:hypothetical protein
LEYHRQAARYQARCEVLEKRVRELESELPVSNIPGGAECIAIEPQPQPRTLRTGGKWSTLDEERTSTQGHKERGAFALILKDPVQRASMIKACKADIKNGKDVKVANEVLAKLVGGDGSEQKKQQPRAGGARKKELVAGPSETYYA